MQIKLVVDEETFKLEDLINKIFYKELAISSASIECNDNLFFESGDDLDEDEKETYNAKLPKLLKDLGIKESSKLLVSDFNQDFNCYIEIYYSKEVKDEEKYPNGYDLVYLNSASKTTTDAPNEEAKIELTNEPGSSTEAGIEADVQLVPLADLNEQMPRKRRSPEYDSKPHSDKRSKTEEVDNGTITLD